MSIEAKLTPPQDAGVESEVIGFDYGPILGTGETISSVVSITCAADVSIDPNASARFVGPSFIVSSAKTKAPNAQVNQRFAGALGGVTYRLQCVVLTSGQNDYSLVTYIDGVTPP